MLDRDSSEGGGAEDEELWKAKALGFGATPLAEPLIESLLDGR
jgi:hypothetical protein